MKTKKRTPGEASGKGRKKKNSFREYSEAILVALLAALFLRAFVVQAFRIPTGSMKDTLLVGDFLLVNKFIYGVRTPDRIPVVDAEIPFMRLPAFKQPKRGDVVVFKYPENPKLDYIKRCIAVGGDTIEMRNGEVFVNGKPEGQKIDLGRKYDAQEGRYVRHTKIITPHNKTYVIRHYANHHLNNSTHDYGPRVVPKGHYFMMGDNRDNSQDSRTWGFLPEENVVGEALIIYFSWNKNPDFWNIVDSIRWSRIASLIH
ncbi:signal peptidase I [candidate division KSB1 bacterium]|nr:signal peptidase I [candidate division KSB1 bacterium]NIR73423.1 signal peptidase I [candidate division KSB1 bacterium]NIS28414.1 signal peptidase I [candidate division KSB1 bacterium]NIT75294.1 signal peptidase I [candidate division KSB1 bacterium]NIU29142.1 signal peptidase I [candidate division KSB1 bacterium]